MCPSVCAGLHKNYRANSTLRYTATSCVTDLLRAGFFVMKRVITIFIDSLLVISYIVDHLISKCIKKFISSFDPCLLFEV